MPEKKIPYLCGCVLYLLLRKATLPDASPRQHKEGVKDGHKNPIFMADLVYTFTGVQTVGSDTDTSRYREGKKEGSINVPFNDSAYISSFDDTVKHRYGEALDRVCQFVTWHLNPEMRGWFVKACLDVIDNDEDIEDDEVFYVKGDGSTISKSGLRTESIFELQPFLLGILHYVLVRRADKNSLGIPTLDANSEKIRYKERRYNGQLGSGITRTITVKLYEKKEIADVVGPGTTRHEPEPALVSSGIAEQTDDEVIDGAILRTGEVLVSALGAINTPKINTAAMAESLGVVAAAAKACTPDNIQKENLAQGVSALATALEAQKHAMAERIRQNSKKADSSEDEPDNGATEPTDGESSSDSSAKEKTVVHQTIVNQYGDHPVHIDHVENLKL